MNISELRQKNKNELQRLLIEQSKQHFKLQMQKSSSEASKPHELKNIRLNIARINTLLNQKKEGKV